MPSAVVSLNIQNNKYTTADFAIYPVRNVLVFRHTAFRAMYEIVCAGQLCVTPLGLKDYCVELFTQNGTKAYVQDIRVFKKDSGLADAVWVLASDGVDASVFRFQLGCFQTEDDVAGRIKTFTYLEDTQANKCAFTNFSKYPRVTRICPISKRLFVGYDKELQCLILGDYDDQEHFVEVIGQRDLREPDKIFAEKVRSQDKKRDVVTVTLVYFDTAELATIDLQFVNKKI